MDSEKSKVKTNRVSIMGQSLTDTRFLFGLFFCPESSSSVAIIAGCGIIEIVMGDG